MNVSLPFSGLQDDPVILEIVCEERQKLPAEAFLDFGPALPNRYDVDHLELMVQSPLRVFAYWELKEATILTALRCISIRDRQNFQLLLRWQEKDKTRELHLDPGTTDNWWFDTLPDNHYQLELGLYWGEYGWLPLLASKELVTPRLTLGPASDEEPAGTQAFLEDLVHQTGIGLTEGMVSLPAGRTEQEHLAPIDLSLTDGILLSESHPESSITGISRVRQSRSRPTSGC